MYKVLQRTIIYYTVGNQKSKMDKEKRLKM